MKKSEAIWHELKHHLPFTLGVSFFAVILVGIIYFLGEIPGEELFEVLHPAHVAVSAVATSAIYWKYKKSAVFSVGIGVFGSILIGTLSDVFLPFLAGNLFLVKTSFHLPLLEAPFLILGVALLGAVIGMYKDWFRATHMLHVFLSVFASLFYLLAFGAGFSLWSFLLVGLVVFLAVYVPCCISDIVFPLVFIKKPCKHCHKWH